MKKFKIAANIHQLKRHGISRDITELECTFVKDYYNGFFQIEVPLDEILVRMNLGLEPERYDIPKIYLKSL